MQQFVYSSKAFWKYYLPIFLAMIIPSLILDVYLIQRVLVHHPSITSASGHVNVPWVLELFLGNTILLKGWAISWLVFKHHRAKKSWVIIKNGCVIFHRHVFFPFEWRKHEPVSIEFNIPEIKIVYFCRKSLKIVGRIKKIWLNENGETLHSIDMEECILPAWFDSVDDLYITLNAFMIRKQG
jgi:hypothetical protein